MTLGSKYTSASKAELKNYDRVIKREKNLHQILPDIVRVSLTDMNSLERMSQKNKKSYIEKFGNVLMKNSHMRDHFKKDSASMLNYRYEVNEWIIIIIFKFNGRFIKSHSK